MKAIRIISLCLLLIGCAGCGRLAQPSSTVRTKAVVHSGSQLPSSQDIVEFKADLVSDRSHWPEYKVDRNVVEDVLRMWHQVSPDHWRHGYSHVAVGDRTGTIKLKDGTTIRWMVKPGGLARLSLPDGNTIYLAKELTQWKENAKP